MAPKGKLKLALLAEKGTDVKKQKEVRRVKEMHRVKAKKKAQGSGILVEPEQSKESLEDDWQDIGDHEGSDDGGGVTLGDQDSSEDDTEERGFEASLFLYRTTQMD